MKCEKCGNKMKWVKSSKTAIVPPPGKGETKVEPQVNTYKCSACGNERSETTE